MGLALFTFFWNLGLEEKRKAEKKEDDEKRKDEKKVEDEKQKEAKKREVVTVRDFRDLRLI